MLAQNAIIIVVSGAFDGNDLCQPTLSNIKVETVDAYPSHQQAIERIKELQSAGSVGHYYMAKFPTKEWNKKEVDAM